MKNIIKKNIQLNENIKNELFKIISKYIYKYIKELYENESKKYTRFQRKLLEIPRWSDDRISKNYKHFTRWAEKRYNIKEFEMQNILVNIIKLTTEIMLDKPSNYIDELLINYHFPNLAQIYYKSLKKIARIYYDDREAFNTVGTKDLHCLINNLVDKYLPHQEMLLVLKEKEKVISPHQSKIIDLDLDLLDDDKIKIDNKKDDLVSLHYLSSNEYEDDSDSESEKEEIKEKEKKKIIDYNVKEIILKKN